MSSPRFRCARKLGAPAAPPVFLSPGQTTAKKEGGGEEEIALPLHREKKLLVRWAVRGEWLLGFGACQFYELEGKN